MALGKLFWKLFLGNVALLAIVLFTCLWLIGREVNDIQDRDLTAHLNAQALALREVVQDRFDYARSAELDALVKRIGRAQPDHTRITLILADGRVLADSEANPADMESHLDRKEVAKALSAGAGEDTRLSRTVGRSMRYVAVAVSSAGGKAAGVARVAMPVRTITEEEGSTRRMIWGIGVLMLAGSMFLALGLARLWSQPIRRITHAARSLSRGDLATKIVVGGSDELAVLARSLNDMRGHLAAQLETIERQKHTLESLLAQLHEGVIVAGANGRIVLVNPAAAGMLELQLSVPVALSSLTGPSIEECIPQHELQQLLLPGISKLTPGDRTLNGETIREVRLHQRKGPDLALIARATDIVLPSFERSNESSTPKALTRPGRLLVVSDITPLTKMLQMKTDFATNASHELRTPLSAIRAAVETLLHMDTAQDPDSARHFMAVVDRHSRRLELVVADLLELSRIESSRTSFVPEQVQLTELLSEIHSHHADSLARKKLHWEVDIPSRLNRIMTSTHLLRIVLDNLVDNAIKFTEPGGHILVNCREDRPTAAGRHYLAVTVADDGCGIAPTEQSRVFERFYQVERARSSGELRGSGLGLSIVRHAVAAMKGSVELQSELGMGTRIIVYIPQPDKVAADAEPSVDSGNSAS